MGPKTDLFQRRPAETVRMTRHELESLREYSCTVPTGAAHGKRWRRDGNFMAHRRCSMLHPWDGNPEPEEDAEDWYVGEFRADPGAPGEFHILWRKVLLRPA